MSFVARSTRSLLRPLLSSSSSSLSSTRSACSLVSLATRSYGGSSSSSSSSSSSLKRFAFGASIVAVAAAAGLATQASEPATAEEKKSTVLPNGLDPNNFVPLKLTKIQKYNHDSSVFYLSLPAGVNASSLLVAASFVLVKANVDGKDEVRPYTPIDQDEKGVIKLLVKDYPTGKISRWLHTRKVGDLVELKGPLPKFKYTANSKKEIGMIAGGTGITPFLQVMDAIFSDPTDKTKVTLIFANRTSRDILLKERLDALQKQHPQQLKVIYTIDQPDTAWNGVSGFITKDLLKSTMPPPTPGNQVYICGPPPMMKSFSGMKKSPVDQGEVEGVLKDLGYTKENVFKF